MTVRIKRALTPEERAARAAEALEKHKKAKLFSQVENKWLVDDGTKITGLVHPATREEAEAEMERLGLTGELHERSAFEATSRYKEAITLPEERQKRAFQAISSLKRDELGQPDPQDAERVRGLIRAAERLTLDDI